MNNRIRQFRLKSKLTQAELAELMDVTRQAVTRWESGTVEPSTENLISLSHIFNCSVDDLVGCNTQVKETVVIKEVYVKDDKETLLTIKRLNIFLYIISIIAFIIYLVLRFNTNYSITTVCVILFPLIIITFIVSLICNKEKLKDKENLKQLIIPPVLIIIIFIILGVLLEL